MSSKPYRYTLYTFFGSSCTARVRIAAAHKRIILTYKFIRLHKGDQHLPSFITAINPSASVPALCVYPHDSDAETETTPIAIITQSIAIIEYLEETYPTDIKLLPPLNQPLLRAKVRELVGVVACDIQPVTNMRVFKHVASLRYPDSPPKPTMGDPNEPWEWKEDEWASHFMTLGLSAYEKLVKDCAGRYSVGNNLTMADVCLVAAVDRAERYAVNVAQFLVVERVDAEIRKLECYKKGGFRSQPDTFRSLSLREGVAGKL